MGEILKVTELVKTFKLSAKQRKIAHTKQKVITAVNNISFTAEEGEIYGLLGPNGAGKTTTLRMMATLIKPDSGDMWINGVSVLSKPSEIRKGIGFLTSELKLDEQFTPNYLFNFFSSLRDIPAELRDRRKAELFEKFGIDSFAEVKVVNLSSGMKQKTSLVLSVVHDPPFIIFDEPTNGLDVLTAKVVTDFLLELKAQGKTIILSTHIFSLVEKLCDKVGVIIDGEMQVSGPLSAVTGGRSMEDAFFDLYLEKQNKHNRGNQD
jgi:sodium transport system ATP-binding protein